MKRKPMKSFETPSTSSEEENKPTPAGDSLGENPLSYIYTPEDFARMRREDEVKAKKPEDSDKLYTALELAMQKDHEPFRGTIRYTEDGEKIEERRVDDEVSVAPEAVQEEVREIGVIKQLESNPPASLKEALENIKINSFEDLSTVIDKTKFSTKGWDKEYTSEDLKEQILKIKSREIRPLETPSNDGFRHKLNELVKADTDVDFLKTTLTSVNSRIGDLKLEISNRKAKGAEGALGTNEYDTKGMELERLSTQKQRLERDIKRIEAGPAQPESAPRKDGPEAKIENHGSSAKKEVSPEIISGFREDGALNQEGQEELEDNEYYRGAIDGADSFDVLTIRLSFNRVLLREAGEIYDAERLRDLVDKIRQGEAPLMAAPEAGGFRAKLVELLKLEEDEKAAAAAASDIKKMAEPAPAAMPAAVENPPANVPPKKFPRITSIINFFGIRGNEKKVPGKEPKK